jgi:hypothetical protein
MEKLLLNNRICPLPGYWNDFYNILFKEVGMKLNVPLILGAWNFTSDNEKSLRFNEHLTACAIGKSKAYDYLVSLTEDKWYHIGE